MKNLVLTFAFLMAGIVSAFAQVVDNPIPIPATIQGRIVLSAATSTSLVAGNVTMAPNSAALPLKNFYVLNFLNEGLNTAYLCANGGTASATAGCTAILSGATLQITFPQGVSGGQVAPTLFSAAGTTIDFWN